MQIYSYPGCCGVHIVYGFDASVEVATHFIKENEARYKGYACLMATMNQRQHDTHKDNMAKLGWSFMCVGQGIHGAYIYSYCKTMKDPYKRSTVPVPPEYEPQVKKRAIRRVRNPLGELVFPGDPSLNPVQRMFGAN